jgi:subtilisin family serine protease
LRKHTLLAAVVVAGVAVTLAQTIDGQAGVAPAHAAAAAPAGQYTVTLLTGDRVTLGSVDGRRLSVRPGKGRTGMRFAVERTGEAVYVIPLDAQPLVRAGRVDRRLFDVTGLVEAGYHDEARDSLPLIVRGGGAKSTGARITRKLPAVGGAAVVAKKDGAQQMWASVAAGGIPRVWLDGRRELTLDRSVPQIGAPAAWDAGYTGRGVTVAVLDSGVDTSHPDLVGKVADAANFTEEEPGDQTGHGTHVAATIAGVGRYRGVAPDATLVAGKICELRGCFESAILAGMRWAAVDKKADIVNLSFSAADLPDLDPVEEAVNTLSAAHGTLFVVAAGNEGGSRTVGSPGSADAALTVGAVDRDDALAPFSSQGPRIGDDAVKPDITAPGVEIVAARAAGTAMGTPVDDTHTAASGTSMAAPHVTGAAALLAQQHPDWTGDRLKATLMASAAPGAGLSAYQQGAGRVDAARAAVQTVTSDPVSVSYGRQAWPYDGGPAVRTVTYRNAGTAGVTLSLKVDAAGPAGMFTTSADTVHVPAGGEAAVTVSADVTVDAPPGLYSGALVATAGQTRVVTPLGVHKERESYDLTVSYLDHDGARTRNAFATVVGWDEMEWAWPVVRPDGTSTVRLPKGRYNLGAFIDSARGTALVTRPVVDLTRNLAVTLDARAAKPVVLAVPEPSATLGFVEVGYTFHRPYHAEGAGMTLVGYDFDSVWTAQVGTAPDKLIGLVAAQWARPDGAGDFADSPFLYATAEAFPGRLPTGFRKNYRASDLATVRQRFAAGTPGQPATRTLFPVFTPHIDVSALPIPTSLPGSRVEYVNTNNGVRWFSDLAVDGRLSQGPTAYRAGREYRDEWLAGPIGPAFGQVVYPPQQWASRIGDELIVDLPLYGDRAGHAGLDFPTETARTSLYRDGVLIGESTESGAGTFPVPAEAAEYRLEVADTRGGDLTTRLEAAWTFRSGHADERVALPLATVRFTPVLDANNAAPAGRPFAIPVAVEGHQGVLRRLTVEVSYDDGVTWSKAPIRAGRAMVQHPAGAGFVSLRATAADAAGNTVTQTLIHAYRLA